MAASTSDKITDVRNAARPVSTTVASPRTGGGTSLTCGSLTGWPTVSKVHGVTYQIDSNSNPVAGTQLDFSAIASGSSLTQFTVVDGTDTGNAIGDIVEMLPTAAWAQDLADALTAQHTRTGSHIGISNTQGMTTDTLTVTSGTTLPIGDIITADIADAAITPAKLLAGTGTSWPWQSWVPVWTNLTVSGSTVNARYIQVGKIVFFRVSVVLGGGNAPTGSVTFTLPITAVSYPGTATTQTIGTGTYNDSSATVYQAGANFASTTTAQLTAFPANGAWLQVTGINGSSPFTFGNGDEIFIQGSYEAA